jgi:succinate dehydrogenase / fumarate reductase cytochrome b subunit
MANSKPKRTRPLSPNIQIYRPQLTSVLSIANRITGVALSLYAVALVVWLVAAAAGPHAYATVHVFIQSWAGQILLFGCTFSFFLHLCGGIRHLAWDAGYGFDLSAIYASGWTVVGMSTVLTVVTWITSLVLAG